MSLLALLGQTATVTPRSQVVPSSGDIGEDEYGDPELQEGTPVDYPARLEQGGSFESTVGENRVVTNARAFFPPDAVISHLDEVSIDGTDYEVVGTPDVERRPAGPHHLVVALREVEGG